MGTIEYVDVVVCMYVFTKEPVRRAMYVMWMHLCMPGTPLLETNIKGDNESGGARSGYELVGKINNQRKENKESQKKKKKKKE